MNVKNFLTWILVALSLNILPMQAQEKAILTLHPEQSKTLISRHIYGQFAEHLGTCIYGGLWVGEDSPIPNTQGYRNDVVEALRDLSIPNLRWPGGCFADEYHWMDGIGPRSKRPRMVNNNWGGTVEDNSFGTHEFLNLCELLGCEPYISGNVGSGSVEEMAKWIEYMTAQDGPMAKLRKQNGREKPWKVHFFGVGNESWGCGGSMRPEYYADLYRRYSTYCRNYNGNQLFKIASGASDYDYNWTEVLMKNVGTRMNGLSLHYYTVIDWNRKGSATQFTDEDYYATLGKCLEIEKVIQHHIRIMDQYDSAKNVSLMVDEWGTWWDQEPGTIPGHLFQQNTLRDALVAALTLNIFHKYTDRIRMANIAQIANVLQSMILTQESQMVLTPTYYVFKMYKVHQDAMFIPMDIQCTRKAVAYDRIVPILSATASRNTEGTVHISLANTDLKQSCEVEIPLNGLEVREVKGEILTSRAINDHNTFEQPKMIQLKAFDKTCIIRGKLYVTIPAKAIVTLALQ